MSQWQRTKKPSGMLSMLIAMSVSMAPTGGPDTRQLMAERMLYSMQNHYRTCPHSKGSGAAQARRDKRKRRNVAKRPACVARR